MPDSITLTGLVATTPRHIVTNEGLTITSFRLASAQRRFDRSQERWIDGDTNWYTITTFRQLAVNCASSVAKGERIVVAGKLRIRDWENGDRTGTTVDVEAEAVGHDLSWGSSSFTRSVASTIAANPAPEAAHSAAEAEFPPSVSEQPVSQESVNEELAREAAFAPSSQAQAEPATPF